MKFKGGRIIEKTSMGKAGKRIEIVFRYPKMSDAKQLMNLVNSMISENAMILINKKQTLKKEKEWLRDLITKNKKSMNIAIVTEIDGKVAGVAELRRYSGRKNHVANLGISMGKKYRGLGLATKSFRVLESIGKKNGLKIIESSYYSSNEASARLHDKLGFKIVGRIPKVVRMENSYQDEIIAYKRVKK